MMAPQKIEPRRNGNGWESRLKTWAPLAIYLVSLIWGASRISTDIESLRDDMTKATNAIQSLTRSFDTDGTSRETRIKELERRVDRLEAIILKPGVQ